MKPLLEVEGIAEPYNAPRQILPPVYWQTGHIDAIRVSTIKQKKSLTGDVIYPLVIDPRYPYAVTIACAPTAFASYKDEDGAKAMLYQSTDGGETWRSLGDEAHSPSAANFHGLTPDPQTSGGVIVGTDTGEVWRVTPDARWTKLASGLPMVQAVR